MTTTSTNISKFEQSDHKRNWVLIKEKNVFFMWDNINKYTF